MHLTKEEQKEQIKMFFNNCNTVEERRAVFLMFGMDLSYDRYVILTVMKELKINDKFEIIK